MTPVSYTHLDVYKRQKKDSTDFYKVIEELKKKNKKDKHLSYGNNSGNSYILNNR